MSLAGTDVLAFGSVLKGLLLFRLLRLHANYGPLLLMVGKMVMDMLLWLLLSIVPILAFGAGFHFIYKDKYQYQTIASNDDNCNFDPDEAFDTYAAAAFKPMRQRCLLLCDRVVYCVVSPAEGTGIPSSF